MSDTPQNDSVDSEIIEQPVIETNDSIPHSEGGEQVPAESEVQVDEVAVAKEKANAAYNKQYGEKKQLERDLASRDAELQQFQQAERERQAAQVGTLPDFPDEFDDNFEEKKVAYVNALQEQANFNATNNAYLQQQQFNQQQTAQAAAQKQAELGNSFTANAKAAGATDKEFNDVVTTLNNGGMTGDIGNAIMQDPDGYFIAKHLAANPQEAHELNTMNPILAGAKFAELKVKASALKPKTSKAPAPVDNLQGVTSDFEGKQYKYIGGSEIEVGADW
jgi:hypothetical protein